MDCRVKPGNDGSDEMSALTQLARYIAESGPAHDKQRKLVELHLIDTVGALIASIGTPEGLRLLGFRARAPAVSPAGAIELDLAIRCALARASEIDDIHLPSMTTPGAASVSASASAFAHSPASSFNRRAATAATANGAAK